MGLLVRVIEFGSLPGGVNQDEAFAGYEAWNILTTGCDSWGYRFPTYLIAWGSGMNALASYLMIPFIAVFGLEVWAIRMPQLIIALMSIWVLYLTVRRLRDEKSALIAMAILAVCPWHIMLSRWGLEANLLPGFLLFGMYFMLRAMDNSKWLMLSALMYGLSLYCYSAAWPVIPFLILAELIICLKRKYLKPDRYMALFVVILGLVALPALLFMAINYGLMDEIRTAFISIPKMVAFRNDEVALSSFAALLAVTGLVTCFVISIIKSKRYMVLVITLLVIAVVPALLSVIENLANVDDGQTGVYSATLMTAENKDWIKSGLIQIYKNLRYFAYLVIVQKDTLVQNDSMGLGNLYHVSVLFYICGFFGMMKRIFKKKSGKEILMLPWLLCGGILGCLIRVNTNRMNIVFIPLVMLAAFGIEDVCAWLGQKAAVSVLVVYGLLFAGFCVTYFGPYRQYHEDNFDVGLEEALEFADDKTDGQINMYSVLHPKVLFYQKIPWEEYTETVEYYIYPHPYLYAVAFERYSAGLSMEYPNPSDVYILKKGAELSTFEEKGFEFEYFGTCIVAYTP